MTSARRMPEPPPPVTLLMAMHCHQPVGNFGFVFEEAFAKAYEPFLGALERHPGVRLTLHYSGCLLDWLAANRPAFLRRVRALRASGQVELLASGYYEPILPLVPEADRQGQIAKMRVALRARFGADAAGLWLTERVWEPDLPATLAAAGIRYTIVDANQFASAAAWLPESLQVRDEAFWDLLGCYTTEYAGSAVTLFPASKRLRYWMPFQPVEQTIGFLRRLRREAPVAITFADDGEKFGLWPKTFRWVYEEGWLDQFFAALERERDWLGTATFQDYLGRATPEGRVYLPCGSYEEMLAWSNGNFRNFFAKYPEANAMQQKMLRVSRRIAEAKEVKEVKEVHGKKRSQTRERARLLRAAEEELYTAQCNCAYWHGVFGGLYLAHLRRAVYRHLIAAEALANQAQAAPAVSRLDADGDGRGEVGLATGAMGLIVDPEEGGAITEWTLVGPRLNLLDTLSRRPEPYHEKLTQRRPRAVTAGTPASIHDVLGVKEERLESHLVYDDHRRSGFLDYALQRMPTAREVARGSWGEQRLWAAGAFRALERGGSRGGSAAEISLLREVEGGRIRKTIRASRTRAELECVYALEGVEVPVAALEFTLSLRDARYLTGIEQSDAVAAFDLEEPEAGVRLRLALDPPAALVRFPVETVSESEEGLERTYQGLGLVLLWAPAAGRSWTARLQWTAEALPGAR
jgi:alpha-amylase